MRIRLFGILNLITIVFYVLSPTFPFLEYAIRKDFIVNNLCVQRDNPVNECNGKCHLLAEVEKRQPDNNDQDNNIVPDLRMDDHLKVYGYSVELFPRMKSITWRWYIPEIMSFEQDIFIPPRNLSS